MVSEQSFGSCTPSFPQVVVARGFNCPPGSNPQKSSRDAVDEDHARTLCLLSQQKARLAVPVQVSVHAGAVPGAMSPGSAPQRAQGSPSLPAASSGAGSHEAATVPHPAPSPSRLLITPGRSPPTQPGCPAPTWPPALWRAEDAHHLHVPLLQPPLQPCPGWGDEMPSSSLADVRSHPQLQTMAEPLVSSATDIQSICAPCFCKKRK